MGWTYESQRFKNVERSAAEIINAATNSKIKIDQGKETVDMCLAIQEMREESRIEGRNEGRIEGIRAFIQDKVEDGVTENIIVAKLQRHFDLDEETARKYCMEHGEQSGWLTSVFTMHEYDYTFEKGNRVIDERFCMG